MQAHDDSDEELKPEQTAPSIDWPLVRELAQDLDLEEYDEDVQAFLRELLITESAKTNATEAQLQEAASLLLQDEIDFSPELRELGIEPAEELIELFLAAGANPNQRNSFGDLPLVLAAGYGYEDIVDMLLDAGADRSLRNAHGKQACDMATSPALMEKLMPDDLKQEHSELVGLEGDLMMDGDGEAPLPPFVEDADWGDADEDFFAPKHDCGCGDVL